MAAHEAEARAPLLILARHYATALVAEHVAKTRRDFAVRDVVQVLDDGAARKDEDRNKHELLHRDQLHRQRVVRSALDMQRDGVLPLVEVLVLLQRHDNHVVVASRNPQAQLCARRRVVCVSDVPRADENREVVAARGGVQNRLPFRVDRVEFSLDPA